ncbi:MAG: response regulator [Bacteroidetes bacterium]|nr:response regulator [Bacteroidota bacterium]
MIKDQYIGRKILLVEDNKLNQLIAKKFLQNQGFEISVTENGSEAVSFLTTSHEVDLVLMDIHMPEMDGYQATKMVREMKGQYFADLPIIAFTSDSSEEIRELALKVGMNDLVMKPFQPAELLEAIGKNLRKKGEPGSQDEFPQLKIYSEGDRDYEAELKVLFANNLGLLKDATATFVREGNLVRYKEIQHQCKTTVVILDDKKLIALLQEIIGEADSGGNQSAYVSDLASQINRCCDELIHRLRKK